MSCVNRVAVIDHDLCSKCQTCVRICPVEALSLDKSGEKPLIRVDERCCMSCTICMTRCPEQAIRMEAREEPLPYGFDYTQADSDEVARLCRAAHMHPEQIICFCRRTQARQVAAAILLGHRTPEALSRATGIRTACGVLCVTSIMRLLKAAGVDPGKAPGWQWYGSYVTIWDLSPEIREKYSEYFIEEDLEYMNQLFPREV